MIFVPGTEAKIESGWSRGLPSTLRRLLTGVSWSALGTAFNQGSTFLVNAVAAHLLGREGFGAYAVILATLATLSNLSQLAMGTTVTKLVAELRVTSKARAGRVLAVGASFALVSGLAVTLALVFTAPVLAASVYRSPDLAVPIAIASGVLFFSVVNGFLLGALAGLEAYRPIGLVGIASGFLYVALCAAGGWKGGVAGLLAGAALSGLFQAIALAGALRAACRRQEIALEFADMRTERRAVLRFAAPAALAGISYMTASWWAQTILARRAAGFAELALYAAANNFWIALMFLPNVVNSVSTSLLNDAYGRGDSAGFRSVFRTMLLSGAAIAVGGGAVIALAAPFLMQLFGREFAAGSKVLDVLLLAALPCALWYPTAQSIAARGGMWRVLVAGVLPRDVTLVALALALTPRFGALGLSVAVCSSWAVGLVLMSPALRHDSLGRHSATAAR